MTLPLGGVAGRKELMTWLRGQTGPVALLIIDLRRLYSVNARFGTSAGDHLIETVRRRLELSVGSDCLVAHFGQDDFAVGVADIGESGAVALADRLLSALQRPVVFEGVVIEPLVSIGVAAADHGGDSLMEAAVHAVRTAKRRQVSIEVGHASRLDRALGRSDLFADLARGIEAGEFELHLQPEVDLATGELDGVEALARWRHPTRGLLGPGEFIAPAESSGLIFPLSSLLVDRAIELLGRWRTRSFGRLWLNLSPRQLADGERLLEDLARISAAQIDPSQIGFEITETGVLADIDRALELLGQVRAAGFDLALDDFGTGYSSLSYLRRLPFTTLKIDRSFVMGVTTVVADMAIVESVVGLAHALDLRVVAEGIEDRTHAEAVRQLGVDVGQGYWFGRPVPESAFPAVHQPWCGQTFSGADGLASFTRRAQLLYGALDALPCSAMVTETIGGRTRISAVNQRFADSSGLSYESMVGHSLDALSALGIGEAELAAWKQATEGLDSATVRVTTSRSGVDEVWDIEVRPFADHVGHAERRLHLLQAAFGPDRMGSDRVVVELDRVTDGVVVIDSQLRITWVSQRMCEMIECDRAHYLGRSIAEALHPDDLERAAERAASVRVNGDVGRSWFRILSGRGEYHWFEMASRLDSRANPGGLVINCHDVQALVSAEEARSQRRRLDEVSADVSRQALALGGGQFFAQLHQMLGAVGDVFDVHIAEVNTFVDDELRLAATWVRADQSAETGTDTLTWRGAASRLADEVDEVLVVEDIAVAQQWWAEPLQAVAVPDRAMLFVPLRSRGTLVGSLHVGIVDAPRQWTPHEVVVARRLGETIAHVIVRDRLDLDLTRSEAELQHLATHDALTGLANRAKLVIEVDHLQAAGRPEGYSVVLLSLDGFKTVNDTAGHDIGDFVLREVAARLIRISGPSRLACRLGGDEFVVVVPSAELNEAMELAEALVEAVAAPIHDLVGGRWSLGASAGVAHSLASATNSMLRVADAAMWLAKRAGGGRIEGVEVDDPSGPTQASPGQ